MRAQISGQVFVYIFAMIVAALILVFGYKAINMLSQKALEASINDFFQTLEKEVESARPYGTLKVEKRFQVPGSFREVCFAQAQITRETTGSSNTIPGASSSNRPPLIAAGISNGKTVFLYPTGEQSYTLNSLIVKETSSSRIPTGVSKYLCIPVQKSYIKISMMGCGDSTLITNNPPDDSQIDVFCSP